MKPARDSWQNPALALLLCVAAGSLFAWLHMPLPWILGPLVAMAACNFAGAELRAVRGARETGQIAIGIALGLYFTPEVGGYVLSHWGLLLAAGLFAIVLGVLGGAILARLANVDRSTAFFASVPGGAAEMTLLGERYGARPDRIALAQSLRILIVVFVVPFALTYSGAHGHDPYVASPGASLDWSRLALLVAGAALAGGVITFFGLPNGFMFGPLALTIVLTTCEIPLSTVPTELTNLAQLLIGWVLGSRFERRSLGSAPRYVAATLVSIFAGMVCAAAFGAFLGWLAGLSIPTMVLATAPGGIAEMCITAKVLQLGVPFVTAAHVSRVFLLILSTGPLYRTAAILRRRFDRTK
ncbi:MAG TPA: AbrB family transcriptional regulator [Burkholderiales bacterium]|nr:AbrB family transcriptional regulator [Burkholderiales bacterium]